MKLAYYHFELPPELIASEPLEKRSDSRMLAVDRATASISEKRFVDLPTMLRAGDLLVLNDTKVFPARLIGASATGASVEIFLVDDLGDDKWEVLAKPAKRLPVGKSVFFGHDLRGTVLRRSDTGRLVVKFDCPEPFSEIIDRIGLTPLPRYIKRPNATPATDRERYQTVYASTRGAIAAPTAGLHFTPEILDEIQRADVEIATVTLHVGYGTFEPVRAEKLEDHRVLPERYSISDEAAAALNNALGEGRRIVAVGTTTTRTLESAITDSGFSPGPGVAEITITPGCKFRAVDALLTNFHLPESSLLILVSTFGGHELIMKAYDLAVQEKFRFYSYGDCMFIT